MKCISGTSRSSIEVEDEKTRKMRRHAGVIIIMLLFLMLNFLESVNKTTAMQFINSKYILYLGACCVAAYGILSCSVTYTCLAGAINKASLSWQNRPRLSRLKLLSEGMFVWFPTGYGKSLCLALCDGLQAR